MPNNAPAAWMTLRVKSISVAILAPNAQQLAKHGIIKCAPFASGKFVTGARHAPHFDLYAAKVKVGYQGLKQSKGIAFWQKPTQAA